MRRIASILVVVVLFACSADVEPEKAVKVDKPPKQDDFVMIESSGSGAGGGGTSAVGIHEVSAPVEELRLEVRLKQREFEVDSPIPATVSLRNVCEKDVRIFDPRRGIPADLECLLTGEGGAEKRYKVRTRIPEESVDEDDLVTIEPGDIATATFDLGPIVNKAADGEPGDYQLTLVFNGGHQGRRITMKVWNRARIKEAVSDPVKIKIKWPEYLTKSGVTPEMDRKLDQLLGNVGPDGRLPVEAIAVLDTLVPGVYPALVRKIERTESSSHPEQVIGWNAFQYLKSQGHAALDALMGSPSIRTPAHQMLQDWLGCATLAGGDSATDPVAEGFRKELFDQKLRMSQIFRLTRSANMGRDTEIITVLGDGLVKYERHRNGAVTSRSGDLDEKQLDELMTTMVTERLWTLLPVRRYGGSKEALCIVEHARYKETGKGLEEEVITKIEVWESEATMFNLSLGRVIEAIRNTKLALTR